MSIKLAFMGFRHGHILDVYNRAKEMDELTIVAACEEGPNTREQLKENGNAEITHTNYIEMLDSVDCDVVAVGDYFGKRGGIIIEALSRGKHVISDKPICTSLDELNKIEALAKEKNLVIGCQLDIRDGAPFRKVRQLIQEGVIGEVHAITFGGQHPLMLGTRAGWYFEEGKHGGTINDIGIHAFDLIPWITGSDYVEVIAARSWNAFAEDFPHFHDAGQFMMKLSNGCGVLGDVSYFMPDTMGYTLDLYWRTTFFGRDGILEASWNMKTVRLMKNGDSEPKIIDVGEGTPGGYLKSFIKEVNGEKEGLSPSMAEVFKASRIALTTQKAGIENQAHIRL